MAGIVAQNYGDALFELAQECGKTKEFKEVLTALGETLSSNEELQLFLKHPKIAKEEKKKVLKEILKQEDPYLVHFVMLLIDKSRFSHFSDIVKVFEQHYHVLHHIEVAYVQSARALSKDDLQDLRAMLEQHTGKTIEMRTSIHPELIAGVRIKIKDEVLDNSAAKRLEKMKERVINTTL